jgi:hypothetical protein
MHGLDLGLVDLLNLLLFHYFVHFHEELCPQLNLSKNFGFHADIMVLVGPEKGTVRTDALLIVYTDNF